MGLVSIDYSVKDNRKNSQWKLDSDLYGEWTLANLLQFTKGALLKISKDVLIEEQGKGFDKNPVLKVDGKFGLKPENVSPLGKIQYIARQSSKEILLKVYETILDLSKVYTGEYLESNIVTFNGAEVARNMNQFKTWIENVNYFNTRDKIRFVNTAPYARKLERYGIIRGTAGGARIKMGKSKDKRKQQRGQQVQVPNGVYKIAERRLKVKYKNNSLIKFEFVSGSNLRIATEDRKGKPGKEYRNYVKGKSKGRPYLYPTILFYVVGEGLNDARGSILQ